MEDPYTPSHGWSDRHFRDNLWPLEGPFVGMKRRGFVSIDQFSTWLAISARAK